LLSLATSNTRDFRNNIFSNVRSTAGGTSLHYAAWFNYSASTNLTLDYNDYYAPGTGGVLGRYAGADVLTLPIITGFDANSSPTDPVFITPGGTTAANYLPQSLALVAST
jgi:ankyrin repeat protein